MAYRPPQKPPQGAWARHLQAERKRLDLSAVQAFELVREAAGWSPKSRSAYSNIDAGPHQPSPAVADALASVFGWPSEPAGATETPDDLAGAIRAQTAAIEALVARLDLFVGPLGEVMADWLREQVATAPPRSGVANG